MRLIDQGLAGRKTIGTPSIALTKGDRRKQLFINDLFSNLIVKSLVAKPMIEKLSGYPKVSAYADFYATRKVLYNR